MADGTSPAVEALQQVTQTSAFESLAPPLQVAIFLGGLVLLSAALVSMTSFTRIVIVLSFVRRALTTQEIPPTPVIIGLALFMTLFVMGPTFDAIANQAVNPYLADEISGVEAIQIGGAQLRTFMLRQTRSQDRCLPRHRGPR